MFDSRRHKSCVYARASAYGRGKAHAIQSVVDRALTRLLEAHRILHQRTEQRERQEAVRDRRAVRRFFLSAFAIQVNPLAVAGGFSKRGDALLGYDEPIACCEVAANGTMQR